MTFALLADAYQNARETGEPMHYNHSQRRRLARDFDREGRAMALKWRREYPREFAPLPAKTRTKGRTRRKRTLARIRAQGAAV